MSSAPKADLPPLTQEERNRAIRRMQRLVNQALTKAFVAYRGETGCDAAALAKRMSVDKSVISRRLMGGSNMTQNSIAEMLIAMGADFDFDVFPCGGALRNRPSIASPVKTASIAETAANGMRIVDYKLCGPGVAEGATLLAEPSLPPPVVAFKALQSQGRAHR